MELALATMLVALPLALATLRIVLSDARTMLIRDLDVFAILVVGLLASWLGLDAAMGAGFAAVVEALARAALVAGALAAVGWTFRAARGIDGLGLGDVKLCAAWATLLPLAGVANAVTLAAVATLGIVALRARDAPVGATRVPFGVALAPALLLVWLARAFATVV